MIIISYINTFAFIGLSLIFYFFLHQTDISLQKNAGSYKCAHLHRLFNEQSERVNL